MKVTTIALATAFTPTSTFALAQTTGTEGYGSVVAPSVAPASPRLERSAHVEEHRPAASLPSSTVGSASRNTGASIGQARNGFRAPEVKLLTYLRGPALTFSKASLSQAVEHAFNRRIRFRQSFFERSGCRLASRKRVKKD
jgi:hypothetical protein